MDLLPQFLVYKNLLISVGLTLVRITVFFNVLPILGKSVLTGFGRNVVMLSLALILVPVVYPTAPVLPPSCSFLLVTLLLKESVIGMMMAFLCAIVFWIAGGVGFFIDNQRGASSASMFDPTLGEESSPFGVFCGQVITVLFFSSGGFLMMLMMVFKSYQLWPIGEFFPTFSPFYPDFFLNQLDRLMTLIVILAAPLAIGLFLSEFGLGMMNRFAQQLNVFSLAMPVKSGLAAFLIVIYLKFLLHYFGEQIITIRLTLDLLAPVIS